MWARMWALYQFLTNPLKTVGWRFENYGDIYHVDEGGGSHLLVTRHPDAIRDFLVNHASCYQKSGGANDGLKVILGEGLVTSDGDVWRRKRRLIQPSFKQQAISKYAEIMIDTAEAVKWKQNEVVDVSASMGKLALNIVCKALFDYEENTDLKSVPETMEALHNATEPSLLPNWVPTFQKRASKRAIEDINKLIYSMVEKRKIEGLKTDLLSMLLATEMEPHEIRDELVTFFLAGHETTAHALTWTLRLLADHPQILAQVEEEIQTVLDGRRPTLEDLPKLNNVDRVINESMRLYPPAYAVPRVSKEDTEVLGKKIPAGWQIVGWIWHCHRDPRWFEEPNAFKPDRFIDPKFPSHAYVPFGAGGRMCIGVGFAQMEMRLVLASLLQRYKIHAVDPFPKPRLRVTLSPATKVRLRIERKGE